MWILPNSCTLSSWRFCYHWLNLWRVFGWHSISALRYTHWHVHGQSTHWRFLCIISWCRLWGWVISHIVISKTKNCIVLTQSIATTNQETKNLPSTLERQVQTLAIVVEWLTQRNHKLEWQLEQWNDQEPNDQNNGQDRDKRSPRDGWPRGK